jgi:hypothetical protein
MIDINRNTIRNSKNKLWNTVSDGSYRLIQNIPYNSLINFYTPGRNPSDDPIQYPEWESDMGRLILEEEYKEFLNSLE